MGVWERDKGRQTFRGRGGRAVVMKGLGRVLGLALRCLAGEKQHSFVKPGANS